MKLANLSVDLGHNADSSNKSTGPGRIGDISKDISKLSESELSLVLTEKSLLKIMVDSLSSRAYCESLLEHLRDFSLHGVDEDSVGKFIERLTSPNSLHPGLSQLFRHSKMFLVNK